MLIRWQAPPRAFAMRAILGRAMLAQRVLRDPTRRTLVPRLAAFAKLANIPTNKARWRASNAPSTRLQFLEPPSVCAILDTRELVPRALPASLGSTRQPKVPPTALTAVLVNILPPRRLPTRAPASIVLLASIPALLAHTTKACVSIVRPARTMLRTRAVRRLRTCALSARLASFRASVVPRTNRLASVPRALPVLLCPCTRPGLTGPCGTVLYRHIPAMFLCSRMYPLTH